MKGEHVPSQRQKRKGESSTFKRSNSPTLLPADFFRYENTALMKLNVSSILAAISCSKKSHAILLISYDWSCPADSAVPFKVSNFPISSSSSLKSKISWWVMGLFSLVMLKLDRTCFQRNRHGESSLFVPGGERPLRPWRFS